MHGFGSLILDLWLLQNPRDEIAILRRHCSRQQASHIRIIVIRIIVIRIIVLVLASGHHVEIDISEIGSCA
jgi:hypothetical protein